MYVLGSNNINLISRVIIFVELFFFLSLDEGKINVLKIPAENGFARYDETADVKAHQGRVMGLFFDSINSTIHSVSEDKKYKVLDVSR